MITIGIPTYNEEKVIAKTIYSVLRQISKNDEIIVVASGCTDNTVLEIRKVMKSEKRVKLFIEKERKGKTSALNIIIKKAKNDVIVQTDGDVVIGKGAVQQLLKHFKDKKIGAVSGNPVPILSEKNIFYEWTLMSYRKANELRLLQSKEGTFWHLSGYLLAFRKKLINEIPFAKGAVDALMGAMIKEKGYKIVYEPNAEVFVKAPTNIKDFIAQKARVRSGFYSLSSKFKAPRKMRSEIFYFPKELIKVKITRWPAFFFSATVYFYTWLKGWYFFKKNASLNQIWKHVGSTKK